jgi:3-oxoadipate enol-lactonase
MATFSNIQVNTTTTLSIQSTLPKDSNSKPTLIFLHFWGGSPSTFRYLVPLFKDYPTVSPSSRGWGKSTGPPQDSEYSINHLASDVMSIIQHFSLKSYIFVGHSMGGKVAQCIASQCPAGLRGVVLLAPAPPTPLVLPTEEMRQQQIHAYDTPESAEFIVRNVLTSSSISDADVAITVSDCRSGTDVARAAWPTYAAGEDIKGEVGNINVPVLVLVGEHDRVEPPERVQNEVAARLHSKFLVIERVGHLLPLEAPNRVAKEIIRFVESLGN